MPRARAPRKRVGLELGNNAPCIIEPDGDWQTAAAKIKVAGFSHAGQSCISVQRVIVDRSLYAERAVSRQLLDQQQATVDQLLATLKANDATINAERVRLSYTRITSPVV